MKTCGTQTPCSCVDDFGYPTGVAIGNGEITAVFGWGGPSTVMNSTDGINWTKGRQGTIGGMVAFGNNRFIMFAEQPLVSNNGINWVSGGPANYTTAVVGSGREFSFLNYGGGVFIGSLDNSSIPDQHGQWPELANFARSCGLYQRQQHAHPAPDRERNRGLSDEQWLGLCLL
jgi:hypothetical protein